MPHLVSVKVVAAKILLLRGKKVMLDSDLAKLYGVSTKRLNEQVRRNKKRFPDDFMFRLTIREKEDVVANCDHLGVLKYSYQLPRAFTEQGVAMLSSVLNSERSIQVNILIMRAFVKLKELLLTHQELAVKIERLEQKFTSHDQTIKEIFEAIKQLFVPPKEEKRKIIGFHAQE